MAEAVVSFVVERLGDLLIQETEALHGINDRVEEIQTKLVSLQGFLKEAESRQKEQRVKDWVADVRGLAYDASDLIESFVLKVAKSKRKGGGGIKTILKRYVYMLNDCLGSDNIRSNTETIIHRISQLTTRLQMFGIRSPSLSEQEESSSSNGGIIPLARNYNHVAAIKEVVGLEEDITVLVDHLVNYEVYRVVGIYGMGGLGKTTLAQKIYNHRMTQSHFDCLAWVCISQKWQKNDVLIEILLALSPDKRRDAVANLPGEELVKQIFEIQNTKRCLVVLDDIWLNNAWDDLKAAFPVENIKGSKILLTTRNKDVAEYVADSEGFLHQPKPLDKNQSWELLKSKADIDIGIAGSRDFHKMEELGREMLEHCCGLPLGILVLGGILVTKRALIEWERVCQSMRSSLRRGEGLGPQHNSEVGMVLELSYHDLPFQLKSCFLHLSQFGEDCVIDAEQLYLLWIAEGFILSRDRRDEETKLKVADYYLGELVHRSMVRVEFEEEESSIRKFKSCRLHDLMRDLSLNKAKEEDFFRALHYFQHGIINQQPVEPSSTDYYARRLVILQAGDETIEGKDAFLDKKVKGHVCSLMLILDGEKMVDFVRMQRFLRSHLNTFKLLRVLSLENMGLEDEYKHHSRKLMKAIGKLTNLRYLSLQGSRFELLSVTKLEYLETADLRVSQFGINLPIKATMLQNMGQLQHLYLPAFGSSESGSSSKVRVNGSMKLETLVNFDTYWCETKDLFNLTNLQKLIAQVKGKVEDMEEMINYLSSTNSRSLRYLTLQIRGDYLSSGKGPSLISQLFLSGSRSLHRLGISGNLGKLPLFDDHVSFLSSLTMLSIEETTLEEDPMPTLEKIPNLRHLRVGPSVSLEKKEMVCSTTGFSQLTRLRLMDIKNLEKWRVDEGAMPNLSSLRIDGCSALTMLPSGLRFLSFLQELHIGWMPEEFRKRVEVVNGIEGDDLDKVRHVTSITIIQCRCYQ